MTLNIKQLSPKMDDSKRFAYICFWSTTLLKTQHYGFTNPTQPNQTWNLRGKNSTMCGTGLGEFAGVVDLPQHNLLRFAEWQFLLLAPH